MPRVFVSYRRADSAEVAGRIFDRLGAAFGPENVFKDVDSIAPGADFTQAISSQLKKCDVVVVLIGKLWIDARGKDGQRRLDDSGDFVRIEIEKALTQGMTIIPALVSNAEMPGALDLPLSIRELAVRNAVSIRSDPDFHRDMDRLIGTLGQRAHGIHTEGVLLRETAIANQPHQIPPNQGSPKRSRVACCLPMLLAVLFGTLGLVGVAGIGGFFLMGQRSDAQADVARVQAKS